MYASSIMDIFSDKESNLIAPKIQKTVSNMMQAKPEAVTVSDKITNLVVSFYKNFIQSNKLLTFTIIAIIIFLLYRWYNRSGPREAFTNDEYTILKNVLTTQSADLRYDAQPSFNPLYSIKDQQQDKVYYPPEPLPINLPDQGFVYTRDLYDEPDQTTLLNSPENYDYNAHKNSASYYVGTYNTYQDAKDTNIINPLGFSNNFNTTTGNFVTGMTEKNRDVLNNYRDIVNNKVGPEYLNEAEPDYDIKPPYATEI